MRNERPGHLPFNRFKRGMRLTLLLFMTTLLLSGCTWDYVGMAACTPDDSVTFSQDIVPIFTTHCAISTCHDATTRAGTLNLEADAAYGELSQSGSGYLDPQDPEGSLLYSAMTSISSPMPPTGLLDTCISHKVRDWMAAGARDN
jgi:hypothetical protein